MKLLREYIQRKITNITNYIFVFVLAGVPLLYVEDLCYVSTSCCVNILYLTCNLFLEMVKGND